MSGRSTSRLFLPFSGFAGSLCAALVASLVVPLPGKGQPESDEYRVKAAFLFHFAQLAQWPVDASAPGSDQMNLCTFGEDPFGGELEKTLDGKMIGSLPIRVRHAKLSADVRGCQILFIAKGERKRLPALLQSVAHEPVLTVGETDDFIRQGGMILLSVENDRIRFEINLATAEQAGLKMSAKLLVLAKTVIRSRE
jgi:YfiR/HmsC-like